MMMNNFRGEGVVHRQEIVRDGNKQGVAFSHTTNAESTDKKPMKQGARMLMKRAGQGLTVKALNEAKKLSLMCLHCRGTHGLNNCTDLMDVQLGELFAWVELDDVDKGKVHSQTKPEDGALKKNRLYLDTCTTDDYMVNGDDLMGVTVLESP